MRRDAQSVLAVIVWLCAAFGCSDDSESKQSVSGAAGSGTSREPSTATDAEVDLEALKSNRIDKYLGAAKPKSTQPP